MNCVSCDIDYACTTFGLCCFPGVFLSSRVTGACPVTTDLIMRVNVRTTTTTTAAAAAERVVIQLHRLRTRYQVCIYTSTSYQANSNEEGQIFSALFCRCVDLFVDCSSFCFGTYAQKMRFIFTKGGGGGLKQTENNWGKYAGCVLRD